MELEEYKKLVYSEEARKIMEEIKEKFKNHETQIEALELIEQHKGEISPVYFFYTKDLSTSENQEIREKAKGVLDKYYQENPEFRDWGRKIDTLFEKTKAFFYHENTQLFSSKELHFSPEESELATIKLMLREILKRLQELEKRNEYTIYDYDRWAKKIEELDEDMDKAYQ